MHIVIIPNCFETLYMQLNNTFKCVSRSSKNESLVQIIVDSIDDLKIMSELLTENSKHKGKIVAIIHSIDEIELDIVVVNNGKLIGTYDVTTLSITTIK